MNPTLAKLARRALLDVTLKYRPILDLGGGFPGITVVSRYADVLEVLERPREMSVASYGVRFQATLGDFVLLQPPGPKHDLERRLWRGMFRSDDVARVRRIIGETTRELVANALRHRTTVDLIADVADPLALRFVERFYGVPDPGHGLLLRWHQMITFYVFGVYLFTPPRVEVPAFRAAQQLRAYTMDLVARRRSEPRDDHQTMLDRLIAWQDGDARLSDAEITRQLSGIVSGGLNVSFVLAAQVLDRLLDLPPHELESARQAALHGQDDVLREYVLEAARLAPFPGLVWRYCEQDTVLARGTDREHVIPEGRLVALFISAANRDPSAYAEPDRFVLDRPAQHKLVFGHGMHACMGEQLGTTIVSEFVKVILAQPALQRVPGDAGRLRRGAKGTFPQSAFPAALCVELRDQNGFESRAEPPRPRASLAVPQFSTGLR